MQTRRATVSFKTVGCRLNQAETAVMRASFEEAGYQAVPFGQPCDLCVIHGCVVTARAEEDSLRLVRSVKRRYPEAYVVLAGCAAEHLTKEANTPDLAETAVRKNTEADLLAGQEAKFHLPDIIGQRRLLPENQGLAPLPRFTTKRALVKVQDGCDFHCAYCIVPSVRGPGKSRPAKEIIAEIKKLTLCGFAEIVLTGANVGCYADGACRLAGLLERLESIDGLKRLRISSLEVLTAEKDVIDFMATSRKMCRALHLPMQSGSDRILKAMGRRYSSAEYCSLIQYAVERLGAIGLGTDIIAGLPGEDEEAFSETEETIKKLPFSKLHVFGYSPRPGTPACSMPGQVPAQDREKRVKRLMELGRRKRNEFAQSMIGKRANILVEKVTKDGWAEGWTGEYIRGRTRTTTLKPGQTAEFMIESTDGDVLSGKAVAD